MKDSVVIEPVDYDWTKVSAILYDDNVSMVTEMVLDVGHRTEMFKKYNVVGEILSGELISYKRDEDEAGLDEEWDED